MHHGLTAREKSVLRCGQSHEFVGHLHAVHRASIDEAITNPAVAVTI